MGASSIGSGLGLSKMINVKELIKRQTEPLKKTLAQKNNAKDLEFEKVSAYNKLENLLGNFKSSLKNLRAGYNNSLDKKLAQSKTSDIGEGSEYIKVSTKNGSTGGSFNVSVNRLAKPSTLVMQFNNGTNSSFNFDDAGLDGVLQVKVGTKYATVTVKAGDSVPDIVASINAEFSQQGIKASADYNHNSADNSAYIDITGDAGETDSIALSNYNDAGLGSNVILKSSTMHQKAQITVNGEVRESDSNIFKDVRTGVDITAQKVNNIGKDQTVNMITDARKLGEDLAKISSAYNSLKAFTASQSENETVDPDDPSKKIRPPLYSSIELSEAKEALMQIEAAVGDKSLESIVGIGFETDPNMEAPVGTKFMVLVDEQKLYDSIEDIDKIKALFSSMWKVTPNAGAGTSSMSVTSLSGRLPAHLQNAAITIGVDVDLTGSVTKIEATLADGSTVTGNYDAASKEISFNHGSLLEHLKLSFDSGVESNKPIQFSVTASNGIADLAGKKTDELLEPRIAIGGKLKNSLEAAADKVQERLIKKTEEINKLQEKIKSIKDKAKSDMIAVNHMDIIGGIMANAIPGLFNPSNSTKRSMPG